MSSSYGPVTLMSGVTGTGAGSAFDLGNVYDTVSYTSAVSGSTGGATVKIQGSQNGSDWFDLTSVNPSVGSVSFGRVSAQPYARYLRANCTGIDAGVTITSVSIIATQSV